MTTENVRGKWLLFASILVLVTLGGAACGTCPNTFCPGPDIGEVCRETQQRISDLEDGCGGADPAFDLMCDAYVIGWDMCSNQDEIAGLFKCYEDQYYCDSGAMTFGDMSNCMVTCRI